MEENRVLIFVAACHLHERERETEYCHCPSQKGSECLAPKTPTFAHKDEACTVINKTHIALVG